MSDDARKRAEERLAKELGYSIDEYQHWYQRRGYDWLDVPNDVKDALVTAEMELEKLRASLSRIKALLASWQELVSDASRNRDSDSEPEWACNLSGCVRELREALDADKRT